MLDLNRKTVTHALIGGKEVLYDMCHPAAKVTVEKMLEKYPALKFIGVGTIHKVNGVLQTGSTEPHNFFVFK